MPPKVTKITKKERADGFPVEHYSVSAMTRFSSNPVMFRIEQINGEVVETTRSITSVIGKAGHKALDVYYGGSDDIVVSSEQEGIKFGLEAGTTYLDMYNENFIKFTDQVHNKQKAIERFVFGFNSYVKETPYNSEEVIATEEKYEEYVDVTWNGQRLVLPVKLKGYLDKLVRRDGVLKIIDYKFVSSFSNPNKIDGAKMLQAVMYYLLVYANTGEQPFSMVFEEIKTTKNAKGGDQVKRYEMVYSEMDLAFDFFFRFYDDMTRALNGEMVYVPNVYTLWDNEVALIAYIHRLDMPEEQAKLQKRHRVTNLTDLLKRKIHKAANMRKLLQGIERDFVSAKNLNYDAMSNEEKITTKLLEHGMMLQYDSVVHGATVDLYRFAPSIGIKMGRLTGYVSDVEQVLGVAGVRVLAPIPNSTLVGFEVPRSERTFPNLPSTGALRGLRVAIGEDVMGQPFFFDLRTAPHMLVAGASGSGKSVFLHSIIQQLMRGSRVELTLIDPKQVEFSQYDGQVKQYQYEPEKVVATLEALNEEMEARYANMKAAGIRSIEDSKSMKYHVVVVDEYADIVARADTKALLRRLAQKGRACGIHLVVATQRASTRIIDGDTKVNFPVKVVFKMAKVADSQVMIDEAGAEKLLGMGDALIQTSDGIQRLQCYAI